LCPCPWMSGSCTCYHGGTRLDWRRVENPSPERDQVGDVDVADAHRTAPTRRVFEGRRPSGWWALRVEVPAPLVTPGSGSRRPPRSRRGVSVASRPPNRPGLAIRPRAQPARDYRSPITTHAIVGSASDEYRSQRAPNVAADQTVAAACVTQILGRKSISGASAHRPRAGGRSHVCRGARASVIVPSERQGPVVDDLFHDQRGGDALNAG
jgi:hypothetical protein